MIISGEEPWRPESEIPAIRRRRDWLIRGNQRPKVLEDHLNEWKSDLRSISDGISRGMVLFLVSSGLNLIFSVMNILNFVTEFLVTLGLFYMDFLKLFCPTCLGSG